MPRKAKGETSMASHALKALLRLKRLKPEICCDEPMAFSFLHDGTKEEFAAANDKVQAELVILACFICEKCQKERPLPFDWPSRKAAKPTKPKCPHCGKEI